MLPPGYEPFLRAICANPADDAPRLIYADWLEENGEEERAEFIRVQVAFANGEIESQTTSARSKRLAALLCHAETIWRQELPPLFGVYWRDFGRGFVDTADFNAPIWFFKYGAVAFEVTPIQYMRIYGLRANHVEQFAASELLRKIEGFTLVTNVDSFWQNSWKHLVASPNWKQLRYFHLIGNVSPFYSIHNWVIPPPQAFPLLEEFCVTGYVNDEMLRKLHGRFGSIFRHIL